MFFNFIPSKKYPNECSKEMKEECLNKKLPKILWTYILCFQIILSLRKISGAFKNILRNI